MTEARRERKPRNQLKSLLRAIDGLDWIFPDGTRRGYAQVRKRDLVKILVRATLAESEMLRKETPDAGR